jgi:two-component system nitrogen regulation response regulator GlnG
LRDRKEDVALLARTFVNRYAAELSEGPTGLADTTLERLEAHSWPGNVRELENAIKRALVLHTGGVLTPEDFDFLGKPGTEAGDDPGSSLEERVELEVQAKLDAPDPSDIHRHILELVERPLLRTVLERTDGNQIRAAALLGINRNTLRKKIAELEVPMPERTRQ